MSKKPKYAPRLVTVTLLGVVSGLPLLLTGSTLTTLLRDANVEIAIVGLFALAHLPYNFKFLWAPALDRFSLPFLGRRRGWILFFQILVALGVASMALGDLKTDWQLLFVLSLIVATCSASLDVVVDAYRTDVLDEEERGPGGALSVSGYRVALLLAGAGALVASDFISWKITYLLLALVILLHSVVTLRAEPAPLPTGHARTMREALRGPISDIAGRRAALLVLLFLALFKLGEGIAGHMTQAFLIDLEFTKSVIGIMNKGVGLPAAIAGTILGGVAIRKLSMHRALFLFGGLQAAPNLLYVYLAQAGNDTLVLGLVVSVDQFCGGLATAALVVFMMSLCDRRFTAFQYAFYSSMTSILGRVLGGLAGTFQESVGWELFFVATAAASLPALFLLLFLPKGAGLPTEVPKTAEE